MLAGCDQSTTPTEPADRILVSNANHVITVREQTNSISIILEAISDTTANLSGLFTNLDFTRVTVDVNHNGQIDNGMDVGYSTISGYASDICSVSLISENSNTGCGGFESGATLEAVFSSSANQAKNHTIWTYTIPKSEIFADSFTTFTVKYFESGVGYTTYPTANNQPISGSYSFNQVLTYP